MLLTKSKRCIPPPALESLNILEVIKYIYIYIETNIPNIEESNNTRLAVRYLILNKKIPDIKLNKGTM